MLCNVHLVNAQGDVKIGTQTWTSKNLDVSTFRNGEAIPEAKSKEEWAKAAENRTAAFCYYNYDSKSGKVYGKLYNWFAVNDPRGLAPSGYHIPSDAEWYVLTDYLGGGKIAGFKMKSTSGWLTTGNGDNSSEFNALPGGLCERDGSFQFITSLGIFWSSSEDFTHYAWHRKLDFANSRVTRESISKATGLSVRCLRD
jgi:uncharacterized protein (TIGR02145 family)